MIVPGGKVTMYMAILMFGEPGAEILSPDPGVPIYRSMIEFTGATPVPVPIREENGFAFSAEETLSLITERTRLIWLETISNPTTDVADIALLAELAHRRGLLLAIDNTFASPYLCNPLALGADLVVHSLTKYIGGHSDLLGGVVLGSAELVGAARHVVVDAGREP